MSASAERAVAYALKRIRSDPRIAYYFVATESLRLLCTAHAETSGGDPETFQQEFEASLTTEAPHCRSGECAMRKTEAV